MTVAGSGSAAWLPEPSRADDTYANRGELVTDWLKRSTVPRAREARRFLNDNLAKVPQDHQLVLYRALHERWHSAFSELIVARTLQLLGGDIEAEPESESGTRIDFRACFADGEVGVEVVSPIFDLEAGEVMKHRSSLLEIIESLAPPGWRIMVDSLPNLGPSDSKRGFKAAVERLLDTEPPEPAAGLKRVETRLPEGKLRLGILPQRTSGVEGRIIMSEPAVAAWNTSEEKIRKAIKKKRRQGRNVEIPSILAVYANGISTTFEDFDHALYGREASVLGTETPTGVPDVSRSEFRADGVFNKGEGDDLAKRLATRQAEKDRYVRTYAQRHISEEELEVYLADLKNQTSNLRLLLESVEAELSQQRERAALTDTTHAWLLSLRRRVAEVEKDTPEAFRERKQLVELLVESISVGKRDDGRAEIQITYRFGPPPAPGLSEAPEDTSMVHLKNGSLSKRTNRSKSG